MNATLELLTISRCPHGSPMSDCTEIWCTSRLADAGEHDYPLPPPVETITEAETALAREREILASRADIDALIRHCAEGSDPWIAADFDVILDEAYPDDQPALRRYRKARMGHRSFKRKDTKANNHRQVVGAWRADEAARARGPRSSVAVLAPKDERGCEVCGASMAGRRADARTCSPRCRRTLARAVPIAA